MADNLDSLPEIKNQEMVDENAAGEARVRETEEEPQVKFASAMEISIDVQASDTNATVEGKEKGKAEPAQDVNAMDVVSESYSGGSDTKATTEASLQGQAEGQDAISAAANEMVPPPVPPPGDPGSDTVSIIASSISNPTLEVDASVSQFFIGPATRITLTRRSSMMFPTQIPR